MIDNEKKLSDNEIAFINHYLINLRKDKAAIAAGYSEHTAKQVGYQVYNRPHVKDFIEKSLEQGVITAIETTKLLSDTATANLTDYFLPVQKLKVPQVKRGLQELIDELQYNIEIENEFITVAGLYSDELKTIKSKIRAMELDIMRFEIELNKNPAAYRIVDGQAYLVEEMELNLPLLIADKERGKVKSIKNTKDGLQVEMYSALDAAKEMGKIRGIYEKDNLQSNTILNVALSKEAIKQISDKLDSEY